MTDIPEISGPVERDSRDLLVRREVGEHAVVLRVAGEVDMATAGQLAAQLCAAREAVTPPGPVIVDLDGVEFLGSAGLVALVREFAHCDRYGVELRIVSSSRPVLRSISRTGLGELLPVAPTMHEALVGT
ncbi:anti-sigma factor antagonist [Amycolatopsis sp.]|uniref:anti-sigma factor antagonist n=1 Tax=Amycolatopsis sp. TaxID=37632 RepID=UPI002CE53DA8|nr:anti-sigma factor antagonist [Amycolatopsis sp.]HVV13462.1 anti-sigma factor antagonist [Amycolatopsis sp.]